MTTFGDYIKKEREKRGWTQTDFGAKIGINSSAVSRVENGTKQISSNKLSVVSEVFDVDLSTIKDLYYGEKFAKEAYNSNCPDSVFLTAERSLKLLRSKNTKQSKLTF